MRILLRFYLHAKNKYRFMLTHQDRVELLGQNKSYLGLLHNMHESLAIKASNSQADNITSDTGCFIKRTQDTHSELLHVDPILGQKNKVWVETYGCAASKA